MEGQGYQQSQTTSNDIAQAVDVAIRLCRLFAKSGPDLRLGQTRLCWWEEQRLKWSLVC